MPQRCLAWSQGQQRKLIHHDYIRWVGEERGRLLVHVRTVRTKGNMTSHNTGLILGLHPSNERRRYKVTPSLMGWVQTLNQPCNISKCPDLLIRFLHAIASENRCIWPTKQLYQNNICNIFTSLKTRAKTCIWALNFLANKIITTRHCFQVPV